MKGSEELQISTGNIFKELPEKVTLSFAMLSIDTLIVPEELFDPETSLPEADISGSYTPLIVRPIESCFSIIDGCKRYISHEKNRQHTIACFVLQTRLDEFCCGLLRIALNRSRPCTLQERVLFLGWLKHNCSPETFYSHAKSWGFSSRDIERITPLLSCGSHIIQAVCQNSLDTSLVKLFQVLTSDDQTCFLNTFKNLKLSLQTQRELLEWLPEIAYNENMCVRDILSQEHITNILNDTRLNDPQRIKKIHTYLYTKKFPRLSRAQNLWKKQSAALNPDPTCVSFVASPYFEKKFLEVKIAVTDSLRAVHIFNRLATITADEWKALIYPLTGNE
jgi:hypothetical protein